MQFRALIRLDIIRALLMVNSKFRRAQKVIAHSTILAHIPTSHNSAREEAVSDQTRFY